MIQSNKVSYFQFDRLLRYIAKVFFYIGMGLIFAITLLVVVHVIGRYVFREPVPGQVELAVYMMTSAVFLMAGYTQLEKGHILIDAVVMRFSERIQVLIDCVAYILYLVVAILLCWQSFVSGNYMMHTGQVSTILQIPSFIVYFIVAFGWVIYTLTVLMHLIGFVYEAVKK